MNNNTPKPAPMLAETDDRVPRLALSEEDTAKAIGVCPRTLWQHAKDGNIPFLRIGGRKLYRVSSLDAYLAEKEKEGDTDE